MHLTLLQSIYVYLVNPLINFVILVIFIRFILSILIAFNVLNTYNQFVATIQQLAIVITEPLLRPIRRFLPLLGGLDLSPIILLLAIQFLNNGLLRPIVFGYFSLF